MQETGIPARITLPAFRRIVVWHTIIVISLTVVFWHWKKEIGAAFFYGASIFLIPNAYFVWQASRYSGAARTRLVARSIYKGQATKFLLTAIMFAVLFKAVNPALPWLVFVSYGLNAAFGVLATALVIKIQPSTRVR